MATYRCCWGSELINLNSRSMENLLLVIDESLAGSEIAKILFQTFFLSVRGVLRVDFFSPFPHSFIQWSALFRLINISS